MNDVHSLQTVVITKPTAVSNRFLTLLYLSQSIPKLPPHFAKCGGNQQNESLPYFLLLHLNTEEEAGSVRCPQRTAEYRISHSVFYDQSNLALKRVLHKQTHLKEKLKTLVKPLK